MQNCLDVLKQAISFERKGYEFYKQVADQTSGKAVKNLFNHMANEELLHEEILARQFKSLNENNKFAKEDFTKFEKSHEPIDAFTSDLKDEIVSASYEAAAIAAAIKLEKNSLNLYLKRSQTATDQEEMKLYKWLAEFEQGHLDDLVNIDQEIREKIWYDNRFWPI
ncbi:MAG: hypothetical protein A2202_02700 [Bdellovibrionales bacterium RIFOXYA1_FULL_36_14]|nr:MAG: hypothetical protein A2202_02700 [Bdellovibrionales bacterium RIFOXYA1_FULL_36_14]